MFLPSRGRHGPDPHLRLRTALFVIGAGAILAGIRAERGWAVWVGIGVLLVAAVVRILTRKRGNGEPPGDG